MQVLMDLRLGCGWAFSAAVERPGFSGVSGRSLLPSGEGRLGRRGIVLVDQIIRPPASWIHVGAQASLPDGARCLRIAARTGER